MISAICNCHDTCLGLRLVGVDSYFAATEDELFAALVKLPAANTKVLIISEELTATTSFVNFTKVNPQILIAQVGITT